MAGIAFVLVVLFVLVAFVGRSVLQWRRTGDAGLRGLRRGAGAAERIGGAAFVLGMLAALLAPLLQHLDLLQPVAALDAPAVQAVGLLVTLAGFALVVLAQLQMGTSWRIGVDDAERTQLVVRGVFARVRNPIFSGMLLGLLGLVLLVPNPLALAAFVLTLVAVEIQVRLVEEPYLIRSHGESYLGWGRRVGRFVPGLGRFPR